MPELASVNGVISSIEEARTPIDDRGFVFGDGVYEVVISSRGRLFLFDEHLARLRRSLTGVRMEHVDLAVVRRAIEAAFAAAALPDAKIYLQITRGVAPRNHAFPEPLPPPTVVITVRERHALPETNFTVGVDCITRPDLRWGRVDIKSINLLPNCLAKQEATELGCFEAIFIGPADVVREATAANVCAVRAGRVWTHPENERILPGITRDALLGLLRADGVEVREEPFTRAQMMAADEVFLTGTTTEVMPVIRIDGQPIADGKPGPASRRLLTRFRAWVAANGF